MSMICGPIRGKALGGINEEALDVSMIGGPICAISPSNASKIKSIKNLWYFLFCGYFFNQGYHSKFTIIERVKHTSGP